MHCIALHGIALHCIALHRIAVDCVALRCVALHCIALHCIALHCIALRCIALHCIALRCVALHCIALRGMAWHCIALHCIALHCRSHFRRCASTDRLFFRFAPRLERYLWISRFVGKHIKPDRTCLFKRYGLRGAAAGPAGKQTKYHQP